METRKLRNIGWTSIATAVLLAAVLLLLAGGASSRATATSLDSAPLARQLTMTLYLPFVARDYDPTYISPFGIVMYGNVDDAQGLQKMRDAGSKWVTTMLEWSAIEPTKGYYNWSSFDAKAQNAQAAGINVFVLFTSNPSWAAALPGGPVTNTEDLVDFVTLMAERYDCDGAQDAPGSPCVHYWSFYAEPDNGDPVRAAGGKGFWGHNGGGYAEMLSHVSPAIHAADPQAKVLSGGLAYDYFEGEDNGPFVRSFLTDTLTALNALPGGARAYIDTVAFHYYPISSHHWPTIREKALEVRSIMEQHGVSDLPLICPETGYWSAEEAGSSDSRQATWLVQMYVRGLSVGLQHMSWFTVFDGPIPPHPYTEEHGLFWGTDLDSPKPAYFAYYAMTRELALARYQRPLQVADAEGYVFQVPGGREKTVVWATALTANVPFPYTRLRRADLFGNVHAPINDGDPTWDQDYTVNGQIVLRAEQDTPLYVEPY